MKNNEQIKIDSLRQSINRITLGSKIKMGGKHPDDKGIWFKVEAITENKIAIVKAIVTEQKILDRYDAHGVVMLNKPKPYRHGFVLSYIPFIHDPQNNLLVGTSVQSEMALIVDVRHPQDANYTEA